MIHRTYIIAEAGVNHNGKLELGKRLIDAAANAGANAVKFQTFQANQFVCHNALKAMYQIRTTGHAENQFNMLHKLQLTETDHEELIAHAKERGINFLSTPFDIQSLHLLTKRLGLSTIKIASGEITNGPLLLAVARNSQQVILSTGMSTLEEIRSALGVLAFGFTISSTEKPSLAKFKGAFVSELGQKALHSRVILLHCTTEYPTPFNEVNLLALDSIANTFKLPVGFSDHTLGIHISLAAVARGACIIEKHLTLDRNMHGPDHSASLEPNELKELVHLIRDIENAMGDGKKRPMESELKNINAARKSLVAAKAIQEGEILSEENLTCKRPAGGSHPFTYWETLGKISKRNYESDEVIDV